MRIGFRYQFTVCFVVIFEQIRFGVPPPLFFVCGSGFGRCCRFVVLLFKLAADLRALVRLNPTHVVNLIAGSYKSKSGDWIFCLPPWFSVRGTTWWESFSCLSGAWWRSKWRLNPSRVVNFIWLAHSFRNCELDLLPPAVVRCSSGQLDDGALLMFYLEYDDVRNGRWCVGIDPND